MKTYRFFRFILKPIADILWPTKVINKDNYKKFGSGLMMCNHYSKADGIVIASKLLKKDLNVVVKFEAFEGSKTANWFLRSVGCIPVHRGEADITAVKEILKVLKDDKQLLIFPEGTRNKEGTPEMAEFKSGTARFAIKTKKPILPMIYYRQPKPFRRNYLYIGEPFDLEEFYQVKKTEENKDDATKYVYDKMVETRKLLDEWVENNVKKGRK